MRILSGVFEGATTGTRDRHLMIENVEPIAPGHLRLLNTRIKDVYRPSHADYTYHHKYGVRDSMENGQPFDRRADTAGIRSGSLARGADALIRARRFAQQPRVADYSQYALDERLAPVGEIRVDQYERNCGHRENGGQRRLSRTY